MEKKYIEFKTCKKSIKGFDKDSDYIVIGEDETFGCDIDRNNREKSVKAINKFGSIEVVTSSQTFKNGNRIIRPVKDMIYLGIGNQKNLEDGQVYSVFNIKEYGTDVRYLIFDEANIIKEYSHLLFISEKQLKDLSEKELEELKKSRREEYEKIEKIVAEEKARTEKIRKEKEEKDQREKYELQKMKEINKIEAEKIIKVISVIKNRRIKEPKNLFVKEAEAILEKINSTSKFVVATSCISVVLLSVFNKLFVSALVGGTFLVGSLVVFFKIKNKILDSINRDIAERNKPEEGFVELMNSFNDSILLKLKKVEVKLLLLENGTTVTKETISLIKDTTSLCLQSYKIKDENLLNDIDTFLDKTLIYIDSLIDSDKTEELYIENQIYDNVSYVINKNAQIFESMTSDNEKVKKILNR